MDRDESGMDNTDGSMDGSFIGSRIESLNDSGSSMLLPKAPPTTPMGE